MRMRATVAVVSGALALSALAVPASQAAQPDAGAAATARVQQLLSKNHTVAPSAKRQAFAAQANTPAVISKAVVNGGKPIVVTATASKKVTVSLTVSDNSGVDIAAAFLWTGKSLDDPNSNAFNQNEDLSTCKAVNATTSTCTSTVTLTPQGLRNIDATTWHVYALAYGNDDLDLTEKESAATVKVQRATQLTVNAAPEPVKKNATITVTGTLSRANWDTNKNSGYALATATLQFRKKTATTYTNVKTAKSSSTGALRTTVKASVDGYYRWTFAGNSATPPVSAAGDYIDVR